MTVVDLCQKPNTCFNMTFWGVAKSVKWLKIAPLDSICKAWKYEPRSPSLELTVHFWKQVFPGLDCGNNVLLCTSRRHTQRRLAACALSRGSGLPGRRGKQVLASEARFHAPPDRPRTSPTLHPHRSSSLPPCWRGCARTLRRWQQTGVWAVRGWKDNGNIKEITTVQSISGLFGILKAESVWKSSVQLTNKAYGDKRLTKTLTGLGLFVLRLSKKALAAAQSVSSPLSSVGAESFGLISLIFTNVSESSDLHKARMKDEAAAAVCKLSGNALKES